MANCCGGLGACACTLSMLLPVAIGTAGAATSIAGSMSGMSGSSGITGLWAIVNVINLIGRPLLIVSIVSILYGMRNFGRYPLTFATVGGILLYSGMFVVGMSLAMIAASAIILAGAYGIAYAPMIKGSKAAQRHDSH